MVFVGDPIPPATGWLVDRFGRRHDYLRVSLTDRCNFRCLYCMPESGVEWQPRVEILNFDEILRLIKVFANLGVRKVRFTGGEPSVRKGYVELIAQTAEIPGLETIALTTNGTRLTEDAVRLRQAGLTSINVSLDTLRPDRFQQITKQDQLGRVLAGIDAALSAGLPTKVNVVLLPTLNDDEVLDFVAFVRDKPITIRFIEFMPFLANGWRPDRVITSAEVRHKVLERHAIQPIKAEASDVSRDYAIEGHLGRLGFVSSVSESFCGGCSRIRLTADGQIKTCLFLAPERSLRDRMRAGATDEQLIDEIRAALKTKWAGHPPMDTWRQRDTLAMVQIGG